MNIMTALEKTQDTDNSGPTVPFIYTSLNQNGEKYYQFTLNHKTGTTTDCMFMIKNNFGCLVDKSKPNIQSIKIIRLEEDDPVRIGVAGCVSYTRKDDRIKYWTEIQNILLDNTIFDISKNIMEYVYDNDTKVNRRETWIYYDCLGWVIEKSDKGIIHFNPEYLIPIFNKIIDFD